MVVTSDAPPKSPLMGPGQSFGGFRGALESPSVNDARAPFRTTGSELRVRTQGVVGVGERCRSEFGRVDDPRRTTELRHQPWHPAGRGRPQPDPADATR